MSEPTTAAGRALRDDPQASTAEHPHPHYITSCWFCDALLAIEAEARAAADDEWSLKLSRLDNAWAEKARGLRAAALDEARAAVLAIEDPLPGTYEGALAAIDALRGGAHTS